MMSVTLLLIGFTFAAIGCAAPLCAQQAPDSLAARRDSLMSLVLASIKGKESMPAESVFKNIMVLRGTPASGLPRIMNTGFGRSLGVSCEHCHDINDFANDDRKEKQVAREMWNLMTRLNREILPAIPNLKSARPTVNCTTCHRGNTKPALDFPATPVVPNGNPRIEPFAAPPGSFTAAKAHIEGFASDTIIAEVDVEFFTKARPLLGRAFVVQEHRERSVVVIISYSFWSDRFNRRPEAIGSTLKVGGRARTIVGVMPESVNLPAGVVLWAPR